MREQLLGYVLGALDSSEQAELEARLAADPQLRRDLEEEAIQTLRQLDAVDPLAALDGELERQIAVLRRSHLPHSTREDVCRSCGARRQDDGNFCAYCGQSFRPS